MKRAIITVVIITVPIVYSTSYIYLRYTKYFIRRCNTYNENKITLCERSPGIMLMNYVYDEKKTKEIENRDVLITVIYKPMMITEEIIRNTF